MAKFSFNDDSLKKVKANIQASGVKQKRRLALALGSWLEDTKGEIQNQILAVGAVDQGQLHGSVNTSPVQLVGPKIRGNVFNSSEHATVIEWGRRPGAGRPPPLLALAGWAGRKGIVKSLPRNISFGGEWKKHWAASAAILRNMERKGGGGSRKAHQQQMDPITRDLLIVRLIARKIHRKGFAGKHPFSRAWDRRVRGFAKEIASLVRLFA